MNKLMLYLIMWFVCSMSYGQEQVFTYVNGEVKSKTQFIKSFDNGKFTNLPHILQKSYFITSNSGDTYTIKCYKNKDWENEPGDWHYFEVIYDGKVIFSLDYADGWEYLSKELRFNLTPTTEAFFYKNMDKDAISLLFTGITIMSQPPFITIVVVKGGKATLVFNKPSYIEKASQTNNETFLTLCANTVEWRKDGMPFNDAIINTLTIKNGMIYFK